MQVMRAAKDADYEKLTVAGEPLSKKEQKDLQRPQQNNDNMADMPVSEETVQINVTNVSDQQAVSDDRPYAESPAVHKSSKSDFSNTDWEE